MTIQIDKVGRIVIPKEYREQLGILPHTDLEIVLDGYEIHIKKVEEKPSLKKKGHFTVVTNDWKGESDPVKLIQGSRKEREKMYD
jgi:AbrB family looped-hinge helix DNA binding protein